MSKVYYYNAQWLRFFCALLLVFYHSAPEIFSPMSNMATKFYWGAESIGSFATSTFFVLSGFVLTNAYAVLTPTGYGLRGSRAEFIRNRISIIYPIYLLSLAIFLAIAAGNGTLFVVRTGALNQYLGRLPWDSHSTSTGLFSLNLGMNLTLLQAWNPYFLSWNLAAWSLSTLLFFYALFPWLMPRLLNSKKPLTLALLIFALYCFPGVLLSVVKVDGALFTGIIHRNPLLRLPEFMIGILLYRICSEFALFARAFDTKVLIASFVGLGAYLGFAVWLTATGEPYLWYVLHNGLLLPASVFVVIVASHSQPTFSPAWGKRLGNTALSIFALHGPIGALLRLIFGSVGHATTCASIGPSCPGSASFGKHLFLFSFYVVTVVVASLFVQEKVVAPIATALRKRRVGWLAPVSEVAR